MNNTRFATAIHILTLLDKCDDDWLTSDFIARSLSVNPVVVRKEISVLKEAKLVESRKGKEGGVRLSKSSSDILLSELYVAVQNSDVLGKINKNPNPNCPIGKLINTKLVALYSEVDQVVVQFLRDKTLSDFSNQF